VPYYLGVVLYNAAIRFLRATDLEKHLPWHQAADNGPSRVGPSRDSLVATHNGMLAHEGLTPGRSGLTRQNVTQVAGLRRNTNPFLPDGEDPAVVERFDLSKPQKKTYYGGSKMLAAEVTRYANANRGDSKNPGSLFKEIGKYKTILEQQDRLLRRVLDECEQNKQGIKKEEQTLLEHGYQLQEVQARTTAIESGVATCVEALKEIQAQLRTPAVPAMCNDRKQSPRRPSTILYDDTPREVDPSSADVGGGAMRTPTRVAPEPAPPPSSSAQTANERLGLAASPAPAAQDPTTCSPTRQSEVYFVPPPVSSEAPSDRSSDELKEEPNGPSQASSAEADASGKQNRKFRMWGSPGKAPGKEACSAVSSSMESPGPASSSSKCAPDSPNVEGTVAMVSSKTERSEWILGV